eukprot:1002156-Heterocapsa_arctica.AAC.1
MAPRRRRPLPGFLPFINLPLPHQAPRPPRPSHDEIEIDIKRQRHGNGPPVQDDGPPRELRRQEDPRHWLADRKDAPLQRVARRGARENALAAAESEQSRLDALEAHDQDVHART